MNDLMEYLECLSDKKMLIPGEKKSKISEANILRIKKNSINDPFEKLERLQIAITEYLRSRKLSDFFFNCLFADLLKILYLINIYSKQKKILKKILIDNSVKCIFLTGDRELGLTPPLIKAANQLKIKVIVYSTLSMSVHNLGLQRKYKSHSPKITFGNNILNMLVGFFFPLQSCKTKYGLFLFSKGWVTIALKILKMLPLKPWVQGGGNSDFIFVENRDSFLTLKKFGINETKIKLIENIEYLRTINSKFQKKRKKTILFAIPIYFEHKFINWEKHESELRKYLNILSDYSKDVLFSFHPTQD